jgi:hypothetical protein
MLKYGFYVLIIALAVAFLYAWGYVKQQRKTEKLLNKLYSKCANKVVKELKDQKQLSYAAIDDTIKDVKTSLFWTKTKVQVDNTHRVRQEVLKRLLNDSKLTIENNKKNKTIRLQ